MAEKQVIKKTNFNMANKPHNIEAEKSLLGCFLVDDDKAGTQISTMSAADFYDGRHRLVFEAMSLIQRENRPIDMVTLHDKLEKTGTLEKAGGLTYISELSTCVVSAANFEQYKTIVKRDSTLRKLMEASGKIIENAADSQDSNQAVTFAEKQIFDISEKESQSFLEHIAPSLESALEKFDKIIHDKDAFKGVLTSFPRFDRITQGLQKSDLILLAARPACGKTSFAMNIASNAALDKKIVAVFSLEMPREQLAQRMMCSVAQVDMSKALRGELSPDEFARVAQARMALSKTQIYIDDSVVTTPQDILSKCRKLAREKRGLDLIVVDYLQLMQSKKGSESRQQEVSELSRNMKIAAKELKVPIILLSQMSRAAEMRPQDDAKPKLSDLRESGAIEQDADIVLFLYNPFKMERVEGVPVYTNLLIAKHRNGELGDIEMAFHGSYTTFKELPKDEAKKLYSEAREQQREVTAENNGKTIKKKGDGDEGRPKKPIDPFISANNAEIIEPPSKKMTEKEIASAASNFANLFNDKKKDGAQNDDGILNPNDANEKAGGEQDGGALPF